jgi:hypothetical protein
LLKRLLITFIILFSGYVFADSVGELQPCETNYLTNGVAEFIGKFKEKSLCTDNVLDPLKSSEVRTQAPVQFCSCYNSFDRDKASGKNYKKKLLQLQKKYFENQGNDLSSRLKFVLEKIRMRRSYLKSINSPRAKTPSSKVCNMKNLGNFFAKGKSIPGFPTEGSSCSEKSFNNINQKFKFNPERKNPKMSYIVKTFRKNFKKEKFIEEFSEDAKIKKSDVISKFQSSISGADNPNDRANFNKAMSNTINYIFKDKQSVNVDDFYGKTTTRNINLLAEINRYIVKCKNDKTKKKVDICRGKEKIKYFKGLNMSQEFAGKFQYFFPQQVWEKIKTGHEVLGKEKNLKQYKNEVSKEELKEEAIDSILEELENDSVFGNLYKGPLGNETKGIAEQEKKFGQAIVDKMDESIEKDCQLLQKRYNNICQVSDGINNDKVISPVFTAMLNDISRPNGSGNAWDDIFIDNLKAKGDNPQKQNKREKLVNFYNQHYCNIVKNKIRSGAPLTGALAQSKAIYLQTNVLSNFLTGEGELYPKKEQLFSSATVNPDYKLDRNRLFNRPKLTNVSAITTIGATQSTPDSKMRNVLEKILNNSERRHKVDPKASIADGKSYANEQTRSVLKKYVSKAKRRRAKLKKISAEGFAVGNKIGNQSNIKIGKARDFKRNARKNNNNRYTNAIAEVNRDIRRSNPNQRTYIAPKQKSKKIQEKRLTEKKIKQAQTATTDNATKRRLARLEKEAAEAGKEAQELRGQLNKNAQERIRSLEQELAAEKEKMNRPLETTTPSEVAQQDTGRSAARKKPRSVEDELDDEENSANIISAEDSEQNTGKQRLQDQGDFSDTGKSLANQGLSGAKSAASNSRAINDAPAVDIRAQAQTRVYLQQKVGLDSDTIAKISPEMRELIRTIHKADEQEKSKGNNKAADKNFYSLEQLSLIKSGKLPITERFVAVEVEKEGKVELQIFESKFKEGKLQELIPTQHSFLKGQKEGENSKTQLIAKIVSNSVKRSPASALAVVKKASPTITDKPITSATPTNELTQEFLKSVLDKAFREEQNGKASRLEDN